MHGEHDDEGGQIGPSDAKRKKEAGNRGSMQRSPVMALDFVLILTRNHVRLYFSGGVDYYSHRSHHAALSVSPQEPELLGGLKPLLASRSCCLGPGLTLQFDRPSLPITLTSSTAVLKPCWLDLSISCIVACCTVVLLYCRARTFWTILPSKPRKVIHIDSDATILKKKALRVLSTWMSASVGFSHRGNTVCSNAAVELRTA
jgi:hypothetical protein